MILLELISLVPEIHEDAVLAVATYIDEYHMTPFDAFHAGLVATSGERVLSTEQDYDTVGLARVSLAPLDEDDCVVAPLG
ncbi:hypothetical protein [Haladaptatus sp. T7]|uniref:hypothetical protein n=1 Tax=Haladaptatus sp. T7 TaxID=2029368 RepID=UPI0021A253F5|nr:hypothetical protein [Haladaptatus sp. T7]GKZ15273.1 hypothetical protein HAL_31540 [Haladaptatus sp. T7]